MNKYERTHWELKRQLESLGSNYEVPDMPQANISQEDQETNDNAEQVLESAEADSQTLNN